MICTVHLTMVFTKVKYWYSMHVLMYFLLSQFSIQNLSSLVKFYCWLLRSISYWQILPKIWENNLTFTTLSIFVVFFAVTLISLFPKLTQYTKHRVNFMNAHLTLKPTDLFLLESIQNVGIIKLRMLIHTSVFQSQRWPCTSRYKHFLHMK